MAGTFNDSDRLKEEIKANVPIEDVAKMLGLELTGNPPAGQCPTGHRGKSGRSFRLNVKENLFHCFGCDIGGGDVIRLVQIVNFNARNEADYQATFRDALRWLIERYRPADLDAWDRSGKKRPPTYDGKAGGYYTAADLYEKVYQFGRRLLYEPAGKEALDYLLNVRGYSRGTLEKTEWIYFPPDAEIRAHLKTIDPDAAEAIKTLHLQGTHGDLFRAAIPWRDRSGRIMGFFKRATVKGGVNGKTGTGEAFTDQRQEYTAGLHTTADLFNLNACRGKGAVVIVEGPPDAAYISRLDLGGAGIAAVGQGGLSEKHLDGLRALGIKKVILSLDNDEHGPKNTAAAIDRLRKSGAGFDVFVINPADLKPHKDPEDFITQGGGLDAFKALIDGAASWYNWEFRRAKEEHPTDTDQGAIAFHHKVDAIFSQLSPVEFRQLKKMNPADFEPGAGWEEQFADIQAQEAKRRQKSAANNAIAEYQGGHKSLNDLQNRLAEITLDGGEGEPVRPVAERLRIKMDREKNREPGQLLGYPLNRFADIARQIDGVQPGFYIFAGITHVGKTAFLTNVFADLIESNPSLHGIYFSLDDNENVIFNRLLAIECKGQLKINELQKRVDGPNAGTLAAAYNRLIDWAESGRFNIMDFSQISTIETVETVLKSNLQDGRELFAVIDGLQNLDTGKESASLRQKNVDLAAGIKRLVDVYKIPVFSSVEIRKREHPEAMPGIDDIMESGKWGYNASHIWIGHPAADDFDNFLNRQRPEFELIVSVPKSKISDSPGIIKMNLRRAYNQLTIEGGQAQTDESAIRTYTRQKNK